MPKAPEPDKVPINSPADLRHEVDALLAVLHLNETEDSWEKINKALKRFQAVVRGGACRFTDDFVAAMRDARMAKGVCRSLTTERGALSGTALEMVASCTRLGPSFAPLLAVYLPSVLRLFARPNKVYVSRAASTAASIIRNTRLGEVLRFIVLEWRNEGGKSASFREQAAAAVAVMLGCDTGSLAVEKESLERRIEDLEWVIKTGAVGREVTVRADMKKCWEVYRREWPDRVASFTAPMTPTIRKYLKVDQMHTAASSTSTAHPAHPARKPNLPPPSTITHAGPPVPAPTRPPTFLSKSHGLPASHVPARHPLAASASIRPFSTTSSNAAPVAAPLASLASSSLGMGAPPHRAARVDQPRSVSASASTSSSRSASRSEERDPLSASSSSLHSNVSATASRTGFKPTAPSKTAPLASRATRALAASTTVGANGMATMAPPHEPRKARRVVPAAPAVPPPTSSAAPTPAPAPTTLAHSQTSSIAPTPSAASRSYPPSTSSTAPVRAPPGSSHAPFRPKLTSTTVAAAALGATAAAKTRPVGAPVRLAAPAPVVGSKQEDKENDESLAPTSATAPAPSAAPALSTRTRPPRARSPEVARPKAVPSAATLASRERRAARERERERKAAEEAAVEEMRRRAEEELEEERIRREEERKRAVQVPLPVEEEEEEIGEEEQNSEVQQGAETEEATDEVVEADVAVVVEEEVSREETPDEQQDKPAHTVKQDVEPTDDERHVEGAVVEQDSQPVHEDAVEPVHDEVGMDSDMVVESLPASQVTVLGQEEQMEAEPANAVEPDRRAPIQPVGTEFKEGEVENDATIAIATDVAEDAATYGAQEIVEPEVAVVAEVQAEAAEETEPVEQEPKDLQHAAGNELEDEMLVLQQEEAVEEGEGQAEDFEDLECGTIDQSTPVYDDLPPSPRLAAVARPRDVELERDRGQVEHDRTEVKDDGVDEVDGDAAVEEQFAESVELTPTPPSRSIARHNSPRPFPLRLSSPSPRRMIDQPSVFTPPAATRDDTLFTPAIRTPPVRFPVSTLAFSPEPFQTCSIIFDTPPRLDDPPMAVHLPSRARAHSKPVQPDATGSEQVLDESHAEESEDSVVTSLSPASSVARRSASRTACASHPQPVFLPDDGDMSGYDADTTIGDEVGDDQELERGEIDASAIEGEEESFAETEVAEQSREFVMPLNDTTAYDHLAHGDEAEYDDSSANEKDELLVSEQTVPLESLHRSMTAAPVDEGTVVQTQDVEECEDSERDDEEDTRDVLPASPAGTTLDFSDFGVATSSTPSAASRRPLWDESLLDDESANFELEQSKLRFHDETESDLSGASTVLGDLHISSPAPPPRMTRIFDEALGDEPTILKRSLRSRIVMVDLQASTSKTPARVTRAKTAPRDVLGEMQA
ncbi:hypothetical protein Rt10032_c06g2886 [Rhodotorula toruloides]|uniref:CLASP N-terminal domain-containing protein n=1 Tax=Rhodotorula toruloides TaxID=5286 RepID=A0A511KES4_RHOTO|nr:hypothetical protein Rt10032_c06g2886 [Rhodotorula toruloides]